MHALQCDLGDLGQVVADHHQRDGTDDVGGGDPQQIALRELAQALHLLFQVALGDRVQQRVQLQSQLTRVQG